MSYSPKSGKQMAEKRKRLLGMSMGKANAKLLRAILYQLVCEARRNICYQCGLPILKEEELSIEHKQSWLLADDPVAAFFDLKNISFSHRACNYRAAARPNQRFSSKGERSLAYQPTDTAKKRTAYTPEKRRQKYLRSGH